MGLSSYDIIKEQTIPYVYPVNTTAATRDIAGLLAEAANLRNMYTIGRLGLFCYISMANAIEKAYILAQIIADKRLGTPDSKYRHYVDIRNDLW
jgi:UDP-galactopyranose mutase